MKITLEVPDSRGPALIEWLGSMKQPSKTATQTVSLVISTEVRKNRPSPQWLDSNAFRIPLLAITHDYVRPFAVQDVVENTKSGNWGVVVAVNGSMLTVKSSKKTLSETGVPEMEFHVSEAAHLV